MNKEKLIQLIKRRVIDYEIKTSAENPFLVIKNRNPGIASLEIYDEDDEFTLYIGELFHEHFDYDECQKLAERIEHIIKDKVAYHSLPGGEGADDINDSFEKEDDITYHTWSGILP